MVERLREIAGDRRHPVVVTDARVLADILCHDLDIRRPLGRRRPMPPEPFRPTADLMAGVGWPLDAVFARSPRTIAGRSARPPRGLGCVTAQKAHRLHRAQ